MKVVYLLIGAAALAVVATVAWWLEYYLVTVIATVVLLALVSVIFDRLGSLDAKFWRWVWNRIRGRDTTSPAVTAAPAASTRARSSFWSRFDDLRSALQTIGQFVAGLIIHAVAVIMVSVLYLWLPYPAAQIFTGTVIALVLFLYVIVPLTVQLLVNEPNRFRPLFSPEDQDNGNYPRSTAGFFTFLTPGQVKIIVRGERFIRCIMRYDDHTFAGAKSGSTAQPNEIEYWDVVRSDGEPDFHPIPDEGLKSWLSLTWWWSRLIYSWTGAVFTGIWPFQQVRTYKLSRLKKVLNPDGSFRFTPVTDWSSHLRVADTLFFVEVPTADTSDKIPVQVQLAGTIRINNPYSTAYNTDENWATRVLTAMADAVNAFTRGRPVDDVLSIGDGGDADELIRHVMTRLNTTETGVSNTVSFGIQIVEIALIDITPVEPDTEAGKNLAALAYARVNSDARAEEGRGEAAAVTAMIEVVTAGGDVGTRVFEAEAAVRKATAAGESGGTVIMSGGQQVSADTLLLLQALSKGE